MSFLSAVGIAVAIFAAQTLVFLLLRNKLARILFVDPHTPFLSLSSALLVAETFVLTTP